MVCIDTHHTAALEIFIINNQVWSTVTSYVFHPAVTEATNLGRECRLCTCAKGPQGKKSSPTVDFESLSDTVVSLLMETIGGFVCACCISVLIGVGVVLDVVCL